MLEGHQWRQLSPDCRLRLSLFVLFATGLLFLTIPLNFFHELGHAFLIAAVLGWLVDKSLKTKLVRDAFEAAYGYVLAPELKQEIHRVMNYRFLCVECNIVIDIDDVFDLKGFIKVTARFERVIKISRAIRNFFQGG